MKNIIALLISVMMGICVFNSCSDPYPEVIELERFMYLSLSGSQESPIIKDVELDEDEIFPLSVSYGGTTNYHQGEIEVHIAVNNSLVEDYNTKHNTSYLAFPEAAVSLDKTTLTIVDGSRVSDQLYVTIKSNMADLTNDYLLPVSIQSATEGKVSVKDEFKTVYYIIKGDVEMDPTKEKWEALGASSVWQAEFPVENIWDGNSNSYWHTDLSGLPQWFSVNMNGNKLVEGFTWKNRQDGDALPKHVVFETSRDGENWTEVLDILEMPNTKMMQVFELPKRVIARYFRVTIKSNWTNAPYTYVAEVSTWAGEKPEDEYDWEKKTWTVASFSSEWNPDWTPNKLIDGNKNSTWHTALNGMPQWFVIDMKKSRPAIKGFLIWLRQEDHGNDPKHVIFSISEDNKEWKEVLEVKEMSKDYTIELDYKVTNPTPGRYFKVEIKSNWAGGSWTYLGEISTY